MKFRTRRAKSRILSPARANVMRVIAEGGSPLHCSTCGDERVFEQPPCPDGHGAECPERVCVECGAAVLVDPPLTSPDPAHGAPPGRSAASPADPVAPASPRGTGPSRAGSSPAASARAVA
jgi:hypothetical protein